MFGRSGAGKTTLAKAVHRGLVDRKMPVFILDGDELRSGLSSDLNFSVEARIENHRRIAEVSKLAAEQGFTVIVATMAPQHSQRDVVAQVLGQRLVWIYVHAPLDVCIRRDPKGLYGRAKAGKLDNLLDFPFEVPRPQEWEHTIDTVAQNVEGCCQSVLEFVLQELADFAV